MARILLFCLLLLSPVCLYADDVQQRQPSPVSQEEDHHVKSLRVSELNANLFSKAYDMLRETGEAFSKGFLSLKDFVELSDWIVKSFQNPQKRSQIFEFTLKFGTALVIAYIAALFLNFWFQPHLSALLLQRKETKQRLIKLFSIVAVVSLSLVPPLVFGFFLYTVFRFLEPTARMPINLVTIITSSAVTIWILLKVAHTFLKPPSEAHKQLPFSIPDLGMCYRWVRRILFVALFGSFTLGVGELIRIPDAGYRFLLQITALIIVVMTSILLLKVRTPVLAWIYTEKINKNTPKYKRATISYLQHSFIPIWLLITLSYVSWVSKEIDSLQLFLWKILLTIFLLPLLHFANHCIKKIRIFYLHRHLWELSKRVAHRAIFYGRQIDFIATNFLYLVGFLFLLNLWGIDPRVFIFSEVGRRIAEAAFSIFLIIVGALFIIRAGNGLLTRYLAISEKDSESEEEQYRLARLKTLHSVSHNILRIVVWAPAVLLIAAELRIDIMPILATVGVLSVGLSFGVQSLVQDFVTGFFMLLEDAFAVGDLVVVNGQMGRVESLTVRVIRVRSTDGALHTFPYGKITSLSNQTRDYSAAVITFNVGIEADIDQVFSIIKKIGEDLTRMPSTRKLGVGEIEISGVNNINEYALEIRIIIYARPTTQYHVRWEFNRLLKKYLEEAGIPRAIPVQSYYNSPDAKTS